MRDFEQGGRNRRGFDFQVLPEAPKAISSSVRPSASVDGLGTLRQKKPHALRGM
jgi:hypothetical protein